MATAQTTLFTTPIPAAMLGPSVLATADRALKYMLAGNATVTLRSTATQTRFTYKITKCDDAELWFVALLNGPQNEGDYRYLGIVRNNQFSLTKKSFASRDAKSVIAITWTMQKLAQLVMPLGLEIWHEGRCGRCGRKLTVPESIALGLGPECAEKGF